MAHLGRSETSSCQAILASMIVVLGVLCSSGVSVAKIGQEDWGAPQVRVIVENDVWTIEGTTNRVELNRSDLQMTVRTPSRAWSMVPSFAGDLTVADSSGRLSLRPADAPKKDISQYQTGSKTGIRIILGEFTDQEQIIDLQISLTICLEGEREELDWNLY